MGISTITRLCIKVSGIVQGVGFRPFIYNIAKKYNLSGFVYNTTHGVQIEIEGDEELIELFIIELKDNPPIQSEIDNITIDIIIPVDSQKFEILSSVHNGKNNTLIAPDLSICNDCLDELFNPNDRRYLYPFINCTNCGPRLTIINDIPYDRKFTTMQAFTMCDSCKQEYDDPRNRRFHAQPNACSQCGPKVWFENNGEHSKTVNHEAIHIAAKKIAEGKIIAIKGLGGFNLVCDATNEVAVNELRNRKNREAKPLAIMVENIDKIHEIVAVNPKEYNKLTSFEKPIVLLFKNSNSQLANNVAPGRSRLGILLPYTPLHHILLRTYTSIINDSRFPALVMTSANISEEPIEISNMGAREYLSSIADGYLMYDRDILIRADDSVTTVINNKVRLLRRSRGHVPKPIKILHNSESILAVGAELKNTICMTKHENAFVSQHIGDLSNLKSFEFFKETISHFKKLLKVDPKYVVLDYHHEYLSSKWAKENYGNTTIKIQHHHAHMASCMIENNLNEKVIAVIFDGTGLGYDGKIWGGEILVGDYLKFRRVKHLEYFPILGGDSAIKEPWKILVSYLNYVFKGKSPPLKVLDDLNIAIINKMYEKNINISYTSSMGRLFDAVSVLLGGPKKIRYEAEAAIYLEELAQVDENNYYNIKMLSGNEIIPLKELLNVIIEDVLIGVNSCIIAAKFHNTIVEIIIANLLQVREIMKIDKVILSGGVFQNVLLSTLLERRLEVEKFIVYIQSKVPVNDGGISLGQTAIAQELILNNMGAPKYLNFEVN